MAENVDDFVAGWASGVAGLFVTQPVDYVLTRLQSGSARSDAGGLRGLVGMWRGIMPLVATVPVNNAMLMYGYGVGKSFAEKDGTAKSETSLWPIFLGGCAGGFVQSFLQSPVELVKVRLQLATMGEVPSTAALTYSLLNVQTFFRGLNATLLRDVVPHGVWFTSYEWSKRKLEQRALDANTAAGIATDATAAAPPLWCSGAALCGRVCGICGLGGRLSCRLAQNALPNGGRAKRADVGCTNGVRRGRRSCVLLGSWAQAASRRATECNRVFRI